MAIAYPTPILKQPSGLYQKSVYALLKPIYFLRAFGLRLFWHIRAYSIVIGIMVLVLFSIGFLWLYETGHKLIQRRSAALSCAELNTSNQE